MGDNEGGAPKKPEVPEPLNNYGVSALLHYATANGDIEESYRLILEENASVHSLNSTRSTPLHIAAGSGFYTMVEMLLEQGAEVDRKESNEIGAYIPLHCAVKGNHIQIAELLLGHGSDPNAEDVNKMTPLHYCARMPDHDDMARLLLAKGGNPELKDENGYNASYWAQEMRNKPFLKINGIPEPESPGVEDLISLIKARKEEYSAKVGGGKKKDDGGKKKKKKKK
jgi:ankyrin repeat protein